MKIDVLAFAAHPDDAELACAGTLIKLKSQGKKVGIIDLTKGELGTRGSAEIRAEEANAAAQIMQLDLRENLDLGDGYFEIEKNALHSVIRAIRQYEPEIVLANAITDRHPDHGRGSDLVRRASFMAGLRRIETEVDGQSQEPWRPKSLFHYIQFRYIQPDFVVDITPFIELKMEAIKAFKSQFHDPNSNEPSTMISSEKFLQFVHARSREMGAVIEKDFGEGFTVERTLEIKDLMDLV